jgi:hypothetical protein
MSRDDLDDPMALPPVFFGDIVVLFEWPLTKFCINQGEANSKQPFGIKICQIFFFIVACFV